MRWSKLGLAFALVSLMACSNTPQKKEPPPVDINAMQAQAQASYAAGRWAEAAQQYTVLVRHMPQDADLWFRLANACARSEQPDRAVAAYREVLVRDASYSKAWFNMGIVQLRQAANSFLKMGAYVGENDPMREQASAAYAAILQILNEGGDAAASDAVPTPSPGPGPTAPAASEPVPGAANATGSGPREEGSSDAKTVPAE